MTTRAWILHIINTIYIYIFFFFFAHFTLCVVWVIFRYEVLFLKLTT